MFKFLQNLFVSSPLKTQQRYDELIQPLTIKLNQMEELISVLEGRNILTYFQIEQKKNLNILKSFLQNFKIYILFIGTTSSGKSTFLNSLMAQQILPSRSQQCTQGIILIEHDQNFPLDYIEVFLNEDDVSFKGNSTDALQFLNSNHQAMKTKVRLNSRFHRLLPPDLQSRMILVDTPGINLTTDFLQQTRKHIEEIDNFLNEQKELTQIIPITVWLTNYCTVDSDLDIQLKMVEEIKKNKQSHLFINHNWDSSLQQINQRQIPVLEKQLTIEQVLFDSGNIRQRYKFILQDILSQFLEKYPSQKEVEQEQSLDEEKQISNLFIILNKYDERRGSEDQPVKEILEKLCYQFQNLDIEKQIFRTSGLSALNFNIMNYASVREQNQFVRTFLNDFGWKFNIRNLEAAQEYCEKTIKYNSDLLAFQDYQKFQDKIVLKIKDIIQYTFFIKDQIFQNIQSEISVLRIITSTNVI